MPNRVLLLNADANPISLLPLSTVHWHYAVKLFFQEKARVLHEYENDVLHSASFSMKKPSVIIMNKYHKTPSRAKFTRKNLFIRDSYQCQYCGNHFDYNELTIDHVIPRVMGGKTTWENCASSCQKCNTAKGKRLVTPINKPFKPNWHQINQHAKKFPITIPDESWQLYMQWPEHLLTIGNS